MNDEPINRAWVYWAATRTIEQHQARTGQSWAPGTCRQCTPKGCEQLTWAQRTVAQTRGRREAQVPD